MDDNAMYKIPTIDFSVPGLLALAQLGVFAVFTYWGAEDISGNIDYLFPLMTATAGLAIFLSVPNARIAATAGIPAIMIVMSVVLEDQSDMAFWAIFMLIMVGSISYLPAMALGNQTLGLDDETRMQRFGPLWVLFALLMMFMFGTIEGAMVGEIEDEDSDGNEIITELDSNEQMISQGAMAMGLIGIAVFLATGILGMEIGQMRPWHGGVLASVALCLTAFARYSAEMFDIVPDSGMILAMCGILTLAPCAAYEGDGSSSDSEE